MAASGIFSLIIKSKAAAFAAYMPFIEDGGLFVPTDRHFPLGSEIFLIIQLGEDTSDSKSIAVAGKVVWITPQRPQGYRKPGIGVQFSRSDKLARITLEKFIGSDFDASSQRTHTL
ncbi:MAG: PilZ domain-containing protein [Gammaproteobacteria bacterium]|nr:PilZ domain-containing protein [Gammaproteobacteria bacterium]